MASMDLVFSLTEVAHFRRLVAFLQEVEDYAASECDMALRDLVEDCRDDLALLQP